MNDIRAEICEAGRRLYNRELISATEGNISVRDSHGDIWTTPTGLCKGFMTPGMLIKVTENGDIITGLNKPSSELKMHLHIYKRRADAGAVVHTHPVTATAFASAGIPLDKAYLTENIISLGIVPIAPYATPSTDEVPESITPFIKDHNVILLEHHGVLCIGGTLTEAVCLAESVEAAAKTALAMRLLGAEDKVIPAEKIKQLKNRLSIKSLDE